MAYEAVALQRQNELLKCPATVWSGSSLKLARTPEMPAAADAEISELAELFSQDFLKAKQNEKSISSRLPVLPNDFLPAEK